MKKAIAYLILSPVYILTFPLFLIAAILTFFKPLEAKLKKVLSWAVDQVEKEK